MILRLPGYQKILGVLFFMKGVVVTDFDWSIEPRQGREVSVDIDVDFTDDTRDLDGSGLWKATLYGSGNEQGSGSRFGEVNQVLSRDQASTSISNAESIQIRDALTEFDLRMIGCTPDASHVCLELQKGGNPRPDFTLGFLGDDGQMLDEESLVRCLPRKCGASEYSAYVTFT